MWLWPTHLEANNVDFLLFGGLRSKSPDMNPDWAHIGIIYRLTYQCNELFRSSNQQQNLVKFRGIIDRRRLRHQWKYKDGVTGDLLA